MSDPSDASRPDQPDSNQPSGDEAATNPLAKRKIQVGSRMGLDRPKSLKPQVVGADRPVSLAPLPVVKEAQTAAQESHETPDTRDDGSAREELAPSAAAGTVPPPTGTAPTGTAPTGTAPTGTVQSEPAQTGQPATGQPAAPTGGWVEGQPYPVLQPEPPRAKVPKPSVRDPLSADLEREFEAALGGASMDQLLSMDASPALGQGLELEAQVRAKVVKIHGDNVFFSLGGQNEGFSSVRQFAEPPELGSFVDVVVKSFNPEDGLYEVNVPGVSISVSDWDDLSEGSLVEARVTGANTGGLECLVNTLRGFIPASQVSMYRIEDFSEFVDQRLQCLVTEVNPQRRNLVLSRRAVLEREQQEQREQLLRELEVGQIRDGVVKNIREFGAFVDLGGVDGLVHISQLSWERVAHPSEVLTEGQSVRVRVEKIDPQTGKIGLSIRSLEMDPWSSAATDFGVGSTIKGKVTRIAKFGAFVRLGPGVEGLIHISELSHGRVANVNSVLKEGQEVDVKVMSLDTDAQRISLSLKATQPTPAQQQAVADDAVDEPPRPLVVKPQHDGPLKGGTDRPSGGDKFGLQW